MKLANHSMAPECRSIYLAKQEERACPSVSLVISNFNGKDLLRDCLSSLLNQDYQGVIEILVVDAGSTDGTPEMVKNEFQDIKLIEKERIGIGEAINLGLREATGEILGFNINNDEIFSANWLSILVNSMLSIENAGVVGGIRVIDRRRCIVDEAGIKFDFLGIPSSLRMLDLERVPSKPWKVDFVGTPVFQRYLLSIVGNCDEKYFLYSEDEDFCARVKKHGYDVLVIPKAISAHKRSATIGKETALASYYKRRGHIRFIIKNFSLVRMFFALVWHVFLLTTIETLVFIPVFKSWLNTRGSRLSFLSEAARKENFSATIAAVLWNLRNLGATISLRK